MTIQLLLKIGAVGILVALLNQILKHSGKDELAFLLNLAGLILVLSWIIPYIVEFFNDIMKLVNIGGYGRKGMILVTVCMASVLVVLVAIKL